MLTFGFIMAYFSFSIYCDSCAGYGSLGWHQWSFRVYRTFVQALPAFIISIEKPGVIPTGLHICGT